MIGGLHEACAAQQRHRLFEVYAMSIYRLMPDWLARNIRWGNLIATQVVAEAGKEEINSWRTGSERRLRDRRVRAMTKVGEEALCGCLFAFGEGG
jgi:hypothetical protein